MQGVWGIQIVVIIVNCWSMGYEFLVYFNVIMDTVILNFLSQLYCSLQITRHISPYEQQIVMPWLKTFPKRVSV